MLHSEATCIYLDHYGISKFGSRFSHGFDLVCAVIQDFVNRAPGVISSRWEGEGTKILLQNNIPVSAKPSNTAKARHSLSGHGCYVDESTSRLFTGSGSGAPTATVESCRTEGGTFEPNSMDLQVPKKPLWTPSVASSEEIGDPGADSYLEFKFNRGPNQRASVNELSQVPPHSIDAPEIHSNQTALGFEGEYPRKRKGIFSKRTSDTERGRGEPSKVDNEVDKSAREMPANIQTGPVFLCSPKHSRTHPTTIPFGPYLPDVVLPPSPGMFRPSESSSEPLNGLADWTGRYRESPPQSRLLSRPSPPFEVQQYPVELAPLRNYAQHHYGNQSRDPVAYHPYQSPNYRYMPANNVPAPSKEPHIYIHSPEQSSLLPNYPAHNQSQTHRSKAQFIQNHQGQAASLKIGQTLNYHTSDTDLGQPCVSDLTDDQARRMDDHNFMTGLRYTKDPLSAMPMDVKTSGMYVQQQAQSNQVHPVMLVQHQTSSNPGHPGLLGQQQAQSSQDYPGMYVQRQAQSNQDHPGLLGQQQAPSSQDHLGLLGQQQAQSNQYHPGMYVQQQAPSNQSHPRRVAARISRARRGRALPQQQPQYGKITMLFSKHCSASSTIQDSIELPASKRPRVADAKLCASSPISSTGMGWEPEEWTSPKNRGNSQNYDYAFLPPPPLSPPVSELQTLDATEEERVKAKEEVLQLLRQWTTCDTSQFAERGKGSFIGVGVGVGVAPPVY
jgi:hypothetical protein